MEKLGENARRSAVLHAAERDSMTHPYVQIRSVCAARTIGVA